MKYIIAIIIVFLAAGCSNDETTMDRSPDEIPMDGIDPGVQSEMCEQVTCEGEAGPAGTDGKDGAPGVDGRDGEDGADGAPGPQGEVGPQGVQGPIGPVGVQGIQGPQGLQGPTGAPGGTGPVGPKGATGPKGDQGASCSVSSLSDGSTEIVCGATTATVAAAPNVQAVSCTERGAVSKGGRVERYYWARIARADLGPDNVALLNTTRCGYKELAPQYDPCAQPGASCTGAAGLGQQPSCSYGIPTVEDGAVWVDCGTRVWDNNVEILRQTWDVAYIAYALSN